MLIVPTLAKNSPRYTVPHLRKVERRKPDTLYGKAVWSPCFLFPSNLEIHENDAKSEVGSAKSEMRAYGQPLKRQYRAAQEARFDFTIVSRYARVRLPPSAFT